MAALTSRPAGMVAAALKCTATAPQRPPIVSPTALAPLHKLTRSLPFSTPVHTCFHNLSSLDVDIGPSAQRQAKLVLTEAQVRQSAVWLACITLPLACLLWRAVAAVWPHVICCIP